MSPVRASYSVSGREIKNIVVEDNKNVVLNTPAGTARAFLRSRRGDIFEGTLGKRFVTQFPGEDPYSLDDSQLSKSDYLEQLDQPSETRTRTIPSDKGEVFISFTAINTPRKSY